MSEIRPRPCLVCEKPCKTEGQLCPDCASAGHYVTDDTVVVRLSIGAREESGQ